MSESPDHPVASTRHFHCLGLGSVPAQGTKIPEPRVPCAPTPLRKAHQNYSLCRAQFASNSSGLKYTCPLTPAVTPRSWYYSYVFVCVESLNIQGESLLHCRCWFSHYITSDSLRVHRLQPARLRWSWGIPGKNPGVGCHILLQGLFPTQGSNWSLLHWQGDSLWLSHSWCSQRLKTT